MASHASQDPAAVQSAAESTATVTDSSPPPSGAGLPAPWARTLQWIENRRRLSWWLSAVVLLLAVADAWSARHQVNPDGISYLDLGNTVFAHGIKAGANVTWSPAYTWIIGAALQLFQPSRPHELMVVMGLNLAILAVLLGVFAWWLSELFSLLRHRGARPLIAEPLLVLLAYAIFAWAAIPQITVTFVTPDLLLAVAGFAATAILMRIARLGGSLTAWAALGVLLGLGYLVKSGFIVPALVACAACGVLTRGSRARRLAALAVAVVASAVIAGPFIAVLSSKEGRTEITSNGTLNYAWNVDGVTLYLNWTGGNGEFGRPSHPTLVATSPNTFAYPSPIAGSIPIWYDPSYWYDGVRTKLLLSGQVKATAHSVTHTLHIALLGPLILLLVPVVMLWRARGRARSAHAGRDESDPDGSTSWFSRAWRATRSYAYLALPVAGILTYLPLHTEARFIAGYLAMLAITWFMVACGWGPRAGASSAALDRVALATAVVAALTFVYAAIKPLDHVALQAAGHDAPGTTDLRVARALTRAGIRSGDGIALLGDPAGVPRAYFARLDQARVVGNINDPDGAFWRLTPAAQASHLAVLRARSGARVVVSDQATARSTPGWVPINGTGDAYRLLDGS
jgi:hypothetical protein